MGYPKDIMLAAKSIMSKNGFENAESDTFTTFFVAAGIAAERRRCMNIATATEMSGGDVCHVADLIAGVIDGPPGYEEQIQKFARQT